MKKLVISTLFVMQVLFVFAQTGTGVSGKVLDSKTQKPLQNVVTSIQNTNLTQITDGSGKFVFKGVSVGNQLLQVRSQGYKDQLLQIEIVAGKMIDVGIIVLDEDITEEKQINIISLSDNDLGDDNSGSENTSALLQASRDAFNQAAAFNFGQARFSIRGIDNEYSNVMINGISMNRVADGRPQYGVWGGLNDATRNQEFTDGSKPTDYTFGGIAGSQEINTRASTYRKGTRISFLNTNTNYSFRMMGTHVSGMNKEGWAYVLSAGRRWAENGYFDGTTYDANSFFASVEKRINDKHSLNFTSMFAQNKRGKNSPNTNEVTDLVGEKYNSYWGYQDGEKRNSRFKDAEEPLMMLTHYWKISPKTNLNTTLSYQTGKIGNSRFDYTKSNNPDPIYYKNLPSYYTTLHSFVLGVSTFTPDLTQAEVVKNEFSRNPQVDWNDIYRINKENAANGSRIVLYEDRNDEDITTLNSNLSTRLADNILLNAGVNLLNSKTKNFKNLLDLLGGNYYTDITTFGFNQDTQQQSDMNNPNRQVVTGDKYGYNYNVYSKRLDAFTQFKFNYKKIDFYLAQSFSKTLYQREGLYKNGYHPDNSFGKSEKKSFENFGFKGGLTYKLSGRHYFDFNGIYMSKAPNHKDVFRNARVNNSITDNITNESIRSVDASYIIRMPSLKARFTGYFNQTLNSTDINFYYTDGGSGNFVSEVVTGIDRKNKGIEAGIEYQITSTIKLTGVAAYGDFTYTSNPNIAVYDDAGEITTEDGDKGASNISGLKVSGTPQQAYSLGIEYRDPKFWWVGVNANYLLDNYIDVSTLRRTSEFYVLPAEGTSYITSIDQSIADKFLSQEKFKPIELLNIVGGKSWRIKDYTIGIFANMNNVLDFKYKTGGFEQSRSSTYATMFEDSRDGGVGPFGSKYFNGYGRTYMVNLYLTF